MYTYLFKLQIKYKLQIQFRDSSNSGSNSNEVHFDQTFPIFHFCKRGIGYIGVVVAVSNHWFTLTCGLKGNQRVLHCEKIWS